MKTSTNDDDICIFQITELVYRQLRFHQSENSILKYCMIFCLKKTKQNKRNINNNKLINLFHHRSLFDDFEKKNNRIMLYYC